ncbi:AMP-binding protein [Yinghuangia aomiensis]
MIADRTPTCIVENSERLRADEIRALPRRRRRPFQGRRPAPTERPPRTGDLLRPVPLRGSPRGVLLAALRRRCRLPAARPQPAARTHRAHARRRRAPTRCCATPPRRPTCRFRTASPASGSTSGPPPLAFAAPACPAPPDAAACVIFTSGSTGRPKAVVGTAGRAREPAVGGGAADAPVVRVARERAGVHRRHHRKLLGGLVAGDTVVVADDATAADPAALAALVDRHRVQVVTVVPSAARHAPGHRGPRAPSPSVTTWISSGEALPAAAGGRGVRPMAGCRDRQPPAGCSGSRRRQPRPHTDRRRIRPHRAVPSPTPAPTVLDRRRSARSPTACPASCTSRAIPAFARGLPRTPGRDRGADPCRTRSRVPAPAYRTRRRRPGAPGRGGGACGTGRPHRPACT